MRGRTFLILGVLAAIAILSAAVWAFFAARDPLLLIFGVYATLAAWVILLIAWLLARDRRTAAQ